VFDKCNPYGYTCRVLTSCRFAVAVHVMTVLAFKEGEPVTSDLLASSVNTNPVVIRRMLLLLQEAELVETRKGAGLGSRLLRKPGKISLGDIYRAVEPEELFPLPSREPNKGCPVGHCIQKALEDIFTSAQLAMERELSKMTLAKVLEAVEEQCSESKRKGK
jgi:DNA-binding IscR family transcriptional regulator